MSTAPSPSSICPSCSAPATGKFCSACGTPLTPGDCSRCGAPLSPGARFCNECGGRVESPTGVKRANVVIRTLTTRVAGGVGGLLLVTIVVFLAARIGARSELPPGAGAQVAVQGAAGVPDISNMSPRERAARLYDRVMRLHEEQKRDSVDFFAQMALNAYAAIPDLDMDGRYDMARIAMVAGALPLARAQSDTILRRDSTHLLGLLLGADLARAANDEASAKRMETTFVTVAARERQRNLPEYEAHSAEIESALNRLTGARKP